MKGYFILLFTMFILGIVVCYSIINGFDPYAESGKIALITLIIGMLAVQISLTTMCIFFAMEVYYRQKLSLLELQSAFIYSVLIGILLLFIWYFVM